MSILLAFKVFFKALKRPDLARSFIEEEKQQLPRQQTDHSHLRMLAMLQQSGRLIDFFKEDISGFSDADVGACVRKIHSDCAKIIEEAVTVRPVMEEEEGKEVVVQAGYDSQKIKLVGNVKGQAPFKGILVHKGWKAHKQSLPKKLNDAASEILYAAEIEVK